MLDSGSIDPRSNDATSATDRILARGFWSAARITEGSVIVLGERTPSADSARS
ncbi:MAG: hypothetical protein JNK04_20655 [Myxococcales bacterium]|nr:hypothetical protein [Myxococcales bacterium]